MILPLLSTGLKIFQATRKKASSGSDVATSITSRQTTVKGKSVAKPKSIVKARSNKISATKFLQTTPDPSKSKATSKAGVFEAFASIINTINKFLSNILSTLIADNKLTKTESDDERKKLALVVKRQRESNLEKGGGETTTTTKSKSKSKGSFLDRIIKFVTSVAIGALVLAVYKRLTDVIKFFKDTYEVIKGFFEKLGEYVSPLWNIFKWITSKFLNIFKKVEPSDDEKYADKIKKELKNQDKTLKDVEDEAGTTGDEVDDIELEKAKTEAEDDRTAVENYKSDISSNDIVNTNPVINIASSDIVNTNPVINIASDDTESTVSDKTVDDTVSEIKIVDTKKGEVQGVEPPKPERPRDEVGSGEGKKVVRTRRPGTREEQITFFEKLLKRSESSLERTKNDAKINSANRKIDFAKTQLRLLGVEEFADYAGPEETISPEDREAAANAIKKSGAIKQIKSSRSFFMDETKVIDKKKLSSIEKVLEEQSSVNNKLADSIALLAQSEEEDDSPIIVPIPKQKTKVVGGSSGGQMIVMGGDDVNSTMKQILHNKLRAL
tara:strand:- start:4834 stop:6495 length:1662 start_codon:yes stop_codon:yes gene_type:complete